MSKELLPCPFCGSDAILRTDYASYIVCSNRKCFMSFDHGHEQLLNEKMIIEAWNQRLPSHNKDYAAARKVFREWINPLQGEEVTFENYTLWLDARLNSED